MRASQGSSPRNIVRRRDGRAAALPSDRFRGNGRPDLAPAAGSESRTTAIFERDPDLLRHVPEARARAAQREVLVPISRVPRGCWHPGPREEDHEADLGLLVVDGLLARRMSLGLRHSVELLCRGDLLRPWQPQFEAYDNLTPHACWKVLVPAQLAVLDRRFEHDAAGLPGVMAELLGRAVLRSRSLGLRLALSQHAKLTVRLTGLFWHLADRWGVQERDAILVPLSLSHETIADLVSAQRPSVSVALRRLAEQGAVVRRPDGWWEIRGTAPAELGFGPALCASEA